ncbi:MAG: hypothetical protein AB1779_04185, partial [Candidatus Thermoplasmatota archaeon]
MSAPYQPYPQQYQAPQQQVPYGPKYEVYQVPVEPKKKEKKPILMYIGILLIILGIVLAVAILPLTTKSATKLKENYDENTGQFSSYDKGRTIAIYGTITSKNTTKIGTKNYYSYEIDNSGFSFISDEDIANEGENLIVSCRVEEIDTGLRYEQHLKYLSKSSPILYFIPGIVVLVVGILLMVFARKKKAEIPKPYPMPFQPQPYQQQAQYYPPPQQQYPPQ